jgi:hypothetical protein
MRKIIDTHHAIDQYVNKYEHLFSKDRVNKVIKDAIKKILSEYNDESTTYAVWSKSTGICAIIDWRQDSKDRYDQQNHAIIITLPPPKKSAKALKTINPKDVKIIVESLLQTSIKFKESYYNYIQEVKIGNLSLFFEDGKLFDSGIAYFIMVD